MEGGPFWILHFKVEAFRSVQNQVLSTFSKSESFTNSGTYAMSETSDEKKIKELVTVIVGLFSLKKRRLKNNKKSIIISRLYWTPLRNHDWMKELSHNILHMRNW